MKTYARKIKRLRQNLNVLPSRDRRPTKERLQVLDYILSHPADSNDLIGVVVELLITHDCYFPNYAKA